MINKSRMKQKVLTWGLLVGSCILVVMGVGVMGLELWIRDSVSEHIAEAEQKHLGDGVEAAIAMLEAKNTRLADKNRMIWTLGTIGDGRALPVLLGLHTGEACRHGYKICQYEVDKAIRKIRKEGSFGIPKPLIGGVWFFTLVGMTGVWWRVKK